MKRELTLFASYFIFLASFFLVFTFYRGLIMKEYHLGSVTYSMALIQALILSKTILVGQRFHIGDRLKNKPLLLTCLYKALLFCLFVLVTIVIEKFVEGYFMGHSYHQTIQKFLEGGYYEVFGRISVMFFVFIPFFAFIELADRSGKDSLYELFWKK